jgi:polysaccharide export outer membrane protein
VDPSYVLGPGDVMEIGLVGRDDFNSRVRVSADGKILLPYVGSMSAAGRSTLELTDDIRKALISGGFFANPAVRVEVIGIASRQVTVLGFVNSPGLVPLDRKYHLSEILARVGGRSGAGANFVLLTRAAGGAPQRFVISELASNAANDPIIEAGDKIFVPSGADEVFYVAGQVRSPGNFQLSPGMTVRTAIAKAGGVTENGSENRFTVTRNGATVKLKLDDPINVGDIITVRERLF